LTGTPLLPADSPPATTAAATLVRYGPKPLLRVEFVDGHGEQYQDEEGLREQVRRLTSVEDVARTVSRVTIDCPAPFLDQELAVVDMPGSNIDNARRSELVKRTIREFGDALLVTVPSDTPVSETLVELLHAQLDGSLHRCLFVITKIDGVKPNERSHLLETIAARLAVKLGVASPIVLPLSAVTAIGESLPDGTDATTVGAAGDDYRNLRVDFAKTRERIVRILATHRTAFLLDRSAALVAGAFDDLAVDLELIAERARLAREAQERGALRHLGPRIEESRQRHGATLVARLDKAIEEARGALAAVRQESLVRIHDLIAKARGGEGLRAAVVQSEVVLEAMEGQLASRLAVVCVHLEEAAREEAATCASELPALPEGTTAPTERSAYAEVLSRELLRLAHGGLVGSAPAVASRILADQRKQSRLLIVATLIGFLLSFNPVMPLIPLFFLPVLVLLLSPRGEKRRKAYWDLLQANVESSFERLGVAVNVRLADARSEACRQLEAVVGRYFAWYDDQIQNRTEVDRARSEESARVERRLCGDLADLERRRKDLQQARGRHGRTPAA